MEASASTEAKADFNVCSLLLQIQNTTYPMNLKPNNTVIKYTKLPEFDFDSKVIWPQRDTYLLQPRLRRIITLNDQDNIMRTSRSLRSELGVPVKLVSSSCTKRKIVTISEDDEAVFNTPFSRGDVSKVESKKISLKSNRSTGSTDPRLDPNTQKHTIRPPPAPPSRYPKKTDSKPSAKLITLSSAKTLNSPKPISKQKSPSQDAKNNQVLENRNRILKERESNRRNKSTNVTNFNKISISKTIVQPSVSEKDTCLAKHKLGENLKIDNLTKSNIDHAKSTFSSNRKVNTYKQVKTKNVELTKSKSPVVIRVPIDNERKVNTEPKHVQLLQPYKMDCSTEVVNRVHARDVKIGTDPAPEKVDVLTEIEIVQKTDCDVQTDFFQQSYFDKLDVPTVSLSKDRSDIPKDDTISFCSQSLPNLQVPSFKITPRKEDNISSFTKHSKSSSYIIGRATVTYTTKQKIDFHVVDNNQEEAAYNKSSSPLAYPINVVSVLKKKLSKKDLSELQVRNNSEKKKEKSRTEFVSCVNEMKSLNCSYVFDDSKLVKPSEIISTIRVNSGLLQNDFICEQFQRELDFIDSFFESLQYLESCTLSEKCFEDSDVVNWVSKSGFDIKNPEYDSLLSKLENSTNVDDTETMASKSLCLLNLLIRDEQRRAKNLLFVLKMREDALKDFTKSQILWLENKKKQDNTDISRLKKKQRGALLKLQHECGEMQRMRKALLTLSEKRKVALMKTKKNIELKLKNNVAVDQILLSKKKLKRSLTTDRPTAVPLKCFDLSSSGCEDSTATRIKSDSALIVSELLAINATQSVEKSIQTGDSLLDPVSMDQSTDTSAENCIAVDGGYLNILFNNLSLPEIFSSGKHYEVNEIALKSIVNSANNHYTDTDIIEKFIDQIKKSEQERSTTPSTARSLVEELDNFYKGFVDDEKSPPESAESIDHEYENPTAYEKANLTGCDKSPGLSSPTFTSDLEVSLHPKADEVVEESFLSGNNMNSVKTQVLRGRESIAIATQAGPLPVPAGAVATSVASASDSFTTASKITPSVSSSDSSSSSLYIEATFGSLPTPVHSEAEELRRQQLAIEREIKALEQQQCQLLVVREIPDKPPPPYTPPTESRVQKIPRLFLADETIEEKVERNLTETITVSIEPTDAFDIFLQDFCKESLDKHKKEHSDEPWDACNLLPQKVPLNTAGLVRRTAGELKEVLTGVSPAVVSGVGARRSDHIDDILFAEWRRCEPDWTALHNDEAHVKSQIFEGIFQKILTETVDEYKKTVLTPKEQKD